MDLIIILHQFSVWFQTQFMLSSFARSLSVSYIRSFFYSPVGTVYNYVLVPSSVLDLWLIFNKIAGMTNDNITYLYITKHTHTHKHNEHFAKATTPPITIKQRTKTTAKKRNNSNKFPSFLPWKKEWNKKMTVK